MTSPHQPNLQHERLYDLNYAEFRTTSTFSTNQTVSDLPGAGRTLGRLVDVAGRLVERGWYRVAANSNHAGNAQGAQIAAGISQSSIYPSGSLAAPSTNSSGFTEDNLPGAGRTLGLAYSFFGKKLEKHASRISERLGRGPNNAWSRVLAVSSLPDTLDLLQIASLHKDLSTSQRRQKKRIKQECRRLLKYTRSNTPSTQCLALERIVDLACTNAYLYTLFADAGAFEIIRVVDEQLLQLQLTNAQTILSSSRKALVCFGEGEINAIAQRLFGILDTHGPFDEPLHNVEKRCLQELAQFSGDRAVSFLAMRYIMQSGLLMTCRPVNIPFCINIFLTCIGNIFRLSRDYTGEPDPGYVEWELLDNWIFRILANLHTGFEDFIEYSIWNQFLLGIFRNADRFPLITSYIPGTINIIRSWERMGFSPYNCYRSASQFQFYFNTLCSQLNQPVDDSNLTSDCLRHRHAMICRAAKSFQHPRLVPFWDIITNFSDYLLSLILTKRIHKKMMEYTGGRPLHLCHVVKDEFLDIICKSMVAELLRKGRRARPRTMRCLAMLMSLDHFCAEATRRAIDLALSERQSPFLVTALRSLEDAYRKALVPPMGGSSQLQMPSLTSQYRHISVQGDVHIRKSDPYLQEYPCPDCYAAGLWDEWTENDGIYHELRTFMPIEKDFLLLSVTPGASTSLPPNVVPVLAGRDKHGRNLYVGLQGDDETIGSLDSYVPLTEDLVPCLPTKMDSGSGERRYPEGYQLAIVVLRHPPLDWTESIDTFDGVDGTGPFFWAVANLYY